MSFMDRFRRTRALPNEGGGSEVPNPEPYPILRKAIEEGRVGKGHGLPDPSQRTVRALDPEGVMGEMPAVMAGAIDALTEATEGAEHLAGVLRERGIIPGRNPDGFNDDAWKVELLLEAYEDQLHALGVCKWRRLDRHHDPARCATCKRGPNKTREEYLNGIIAWMRVHDPAQRGFTGDDFDTTYREDLLT